MQVQKFGGSSLSSVENIKKVAEIIKSSVKDNCNIVVLSAIGKVTDKLITIINLAINAQSWSEAFHELRNEHLQILQTITRDEYENQQGKQIIKLFEKAEDHLHGCSLLSQCPNDIYSSLATLGERVSILIMQVQLRQLGLETDIIDAQQCIKTVNSEIDSEADLETTKKNFKQYRHTSKQVLLMAGFTASTHNGKATTLGRNGSDYSAALAAVGLKAQSCTIWTDVDGVYNANPSDVKDAYLIPQLSYYEAMELSYFGASVLHPKTITPLMKANIPCIIKNTFHPDTQGTVISQTPYQGENFATAISSLDNISMVTVSGPGMKGMVGMASSVFESLSNHNISIIMITQSSSEYSISFCIDSKQKNIAQKCLQERFALELKNQLLEPIYFQDQLSIITLVSDNMKKRRGTAAQFFQSLAIANVNIVAIAQGSNERSISAVVEQDRLVRGLRSCHQLFFDGRQQVEIILIGCGLVGDAFLQQILQQQQYLHEQNISVKVCGIINSKGALLAENGIDINSYKTLIESKLESISKEKLKSFRQQSNMINPIIVDCTSSQNVAEVYLDFFNAGYHVIAANKKANTLSYDYYIKLQKTAIKMNRQFLYETNVGAGLPVMDTLKNLLRAGDRLNQFEGILSGSMSYIFGKLDEGMPLSQAVKKAKAKGFTEPDPRDDLSGMDIARKVLIVAREAGHKLELKDIQIDSLLNEELLNYDSIDDFMLNLTNIDEHIQNMSHEAKNNGCVLRYVGSIENGVAKVSIKSVNKKSALHSIKDGENAIAFFSNYYHPIPMVLRGYGAGAAVTAAGVFADVMKILPSKSSYI